MVEPRERPDPDELLLRVKGEERRARLEIFFGFAPGVGKTYRMLEVARALAKTRRVVVGVVETHQRADTARLLEGLEILPRRKADYRGRTLEELDLDRALATRPDLILVDELAHTNAPGSRHPKRWQDVEELLAAGIDVLTTLNVQHVESLNDVVSQITRVKVRETVPDTFLERADSIELIDISPEALLDRLAAGKVYLPEQARRAAEHFFARGNLLALRELALRRTADHVDGDVREYRARHGVSATWPTGERIAVCVGPAPSSGRLIRAAARMAAGLRAEWIAVYVESPIARFGDADRERLEAHLRMAEALGGSVVRLSGESVAEALLAHARKQNVTRIVVGKPTHSRLRDRIGGSLLDAIVRGSGDIEVQVVGGPAEAERSPEGASEVERAFDPKPYLASGLWVAGTLGVAMSLKALFDLPDLEMLFLLTVMITAMGYGRGPSLFAAALGVASYDFFFVPPYHTFSVTDRRYFLTFGMMFAVSMIVSELVARLRAQEREARGREERANVLFALTRELAAADETTEIATVATRHAQRIFGATAVLLTPGAGERPEAIASAPAGVTLDAKELGVARWAIEHGQLAGAGTDTLAGASSLSSPLVVGGRSLGALALIPEAQRAQSAEQRELLDVFSRQVAMALERARLGGEARASALEAKSEQMRSSLLSAVSHDLRTPLAVMTGAATSLRDDPSLEPATRAELVESICGEAERLERLVTNLLDMTRLDSGAVTLKREWVPLGELVGAALTRLEQRLEHHAVAVEVGEGLAHVDVVLIEQVLINLLENAAKYSPPGARVSIRGAVERGRLTLEVRDDGPGLAPGSEERVFDKFYRGAHPGVGGAGLGLPICRAIVEAHGGTITASSEGGAVFRISIPIEGAPPAVPMETTS